MNNDQILAFDLLLHRLTQPMTALRGLLEVSLMGDLNPEICRQTLEEALGQAERASEVLDQMREILETAQLERVLRDLSWSEVLGRAVAVLQPFAEARHLTLAMDLEETSSVRANPDLLDAATRQSLSLAMEWTPTGGAIRLCLGPADNDLALSICSDRTEREARLPAGHGEKTQPSAEVLSWSRIQALIRAQSGSAQVKKLSPEGFCIEIRLPRSRPTPLPQG